MPAEPRATEEREASIEEIADGIALWQEHRPRTIEDWQRIARDFSAECDELRAKLDEATVHAVPLMELREQAERAERAERALERLLEPDDETLERAQTLANVPIGRKMLRRFLAALAETTTTRESER